MKTLEMKITLPLVAKDGRWRKWQREFWERNPLEEYSDLEKFGIMKSWAEKLGIQLNPWYISKAAIKRRKWTEGMILKFLGEPDDYQNNPVYSSMPQMQLWMFQKVLMLEENNLEIQSKITGKKFWGEI